MKFKFIKGVIMGAIISGAAVWWWNSESGKETREKVKDSVEDFSDFIRPRISRFKKISYRKFQRFLKNAAMEYANVRDLSMEKLDKLVERAHKLAGQE